MSQHNALPKSSRFDVRQIDFAGEPLYIAGFAGDPYFNTIDQQLVHCNLLSAVLFHFVSPGSTIIDVGANIGLTTALTHRLVRDARILSIEPSRVYDCLLETVRLNNISRQTSHKMCAGNEDGEGFLVELDNSSASHLSLEGLGHSRVPVRRIDTLVADEGLDRVDFVKIDVEGFEPCVLDGMVRVLETHKPLVMMEINSFTLSAYGRRSPRDVLDLVVSRFGGFVADVGTLRYFKTQEDVLGFLSGNMLERGCVDDIIFSPSLERIAAFGVG